MVRERLRARTRQELPPGSRIAHSLIPETLTSFSVSSSMKYISRYPSRPQHTSILDIESQMATSDSMIFLRK